MTGLATSPSRSSRFVPFHSFPANLSRPATATAAGRRRFPGLLVWLALTSLLSAKPPESAAIVMDAATGEVLQIENPSLAIASAFPPGSLIKLYTALFALRQGRIQPQAVVNCTGRGRFGGEELECWLLPGHGPVNFSKALAYSCNIYFAELARRLYPADFLAFLRQAGLGRRVAAAWPGEVPGELPPAEDRASLTRLAAGLSTRLQVTPLQLAVFLAAIVNGGRLLTPVPEGTPAETAGDLECADVLPVLRHALQEGSTYGTSREFFQRFGGFAKTGTAPRTEGFRTHGWLAGYLPDARRPLVLVVFAMDGTGSGTALPLALQLAGRWRTPLPTPRTGR